LYSSHFQAAFVPACKGEETAAKPSEESRPSSPIPCQPRENEWLLGPYRQLRPMRHARAVDDAKSLSRYCIVVQILGLMEPHIVTWRTIIVNRLCHDDKQSGK